MALAKSIAEGSKVAYVGAVIPNKTPDKGAVGTLNRIIFPKDGGTSQFEVGFQDGTVFTAPFNDWLTAEDYSSARTQTFVALGLTAAVVIGLGVWFATRSK